MRQTAKTAFPSVALTLLLVGTVAGCSGAPNLSTGSLFGGGDKPAAPVAPVVKNDPSARAFQVGTTSARALKCGFNFDVAKLKNQYLASEAATAGAGELPKIEQTYDVAFRAVAKAVSGQKAEYCSELKTAEIKLALARHLSGDYTPAAPRQQVAGEEGLFGSSSSSSNSSSRIPTPYDQDY